VHTLVVGAGLSGLACAGELLRHGREVTLLEAAARPGGVVGTLEDGGFRFETGPNTVLASAPTFRAVCDELGIAPRLIASGDAARARLVWLRGRLVAVPSSPLSFLFSPLLSARAKLRLATEPLRRRAPHPPDAPEPSAAAFFEERLGREPTSVLAAAFVRGIYAGDLERLGARSAFPRLWAMVEEHGGILRGMLARRRETRRGPRDERGGLRGMLSFPNGLQELVDALAAPLGEGLRCGVRVRGLARQGDAWRASVEGGADLSADEVVVATPAARAAELLEGTAGEGVLDALRGIRHAGIALVHVGFAQAPRVPPAFGFLVPPGAEGAGRDAPRLLGAILASNVFPGRAPAGALACTAFYSPEDLPDDEGEAVRLGWGVAPTPAAGRVLLWRSAIPQYDIGHLERVGAAVAALEKEEPTLRLAGNYVSGVSIEDVLRRGREVAGALAGREADGGPPLRTGTRT